VAAGCLLVSGWSGEGVRRAIAGRVRVVVTGDVGGNAELGGFGLGGMALSCSISRSPLLQLQGEDRHLPLAV
jgi:hypothetical protein